MAIKTFPKNSTKKVCFECPIDLYHDLVDFAEVSKKYKGKHTLLLLEDTTDLSKVVRVACLMFVKYHSVILPSS